MCPFLSKTNPEPTPAGISLSSDLCTLTRTTPASEFSKISISDISFAYTGIDSPTVATSWPFVTEISGFSIPVGGTTNIVNTTSAKTAPAIPPTMIPDLSKRLWFALLQIKKILLNPNGVLNVVLHRVCSPPP